MLEVSAHMDVCVSVTVYACVYGSMAVYFLLALCFCFLVALKLAKQLLIGVAGREH